MFGFNERVGKSYFKEFASDELAVSTTFCTLQGEGPYSGKRCIFLRLSKCLLSCYFCDSAFEDYTTYRFEDLKLELQNKVIKWMEDNSVAYDMQYPMKDWGLVLTGGEPMLQTNLWDFVEYVQRSSYTKFSWVQIETTGTQPWKPEYYPSTCVVVSPKCVEFDRLPVRYLVPHETMLARADCLKFVISANVESPYYKIPEWALEWSERQGKQIYVSPMNVYLKEPAAMLLAAKTNKNATAEEREILERISFYEEGLLDMEKNRKNHEHAAFLAMKHNAKLSLQTHLYANLP